MMEVLRPFLGEMASRVSALVGVPEQSPFNTLDRQAVYPRLKELLDDWTAVR
jgi:hypothetical protein